MCKWKHPHQQENVVEPLGHLGVEVRGEHFGGGQHGMVGPVLGLRQPQDLQRKASAYILQKREEKKRRFRDENCCLCMYEVLRIYTYIYASKNKHNTYKYVDKTYIPGHRHVPMSFYEFFDLNSFCLLKALSTPGIIQVSSVTACFQTP